MRDNEPPEQATSDEDSLPGNRQHQGTTPGNSPEGPALSACRPPFSTATPAETAVHRNFCNAISGLRRELVRTIGYLRIIFDRKIYRALGYVSIRQYAAEHGELDENQCKAFLRIGARLAELPAMRTALAEGSLTWRKANLIVGAANDSNQQELVELAKRLSVKALREALPKAVPPARQAGKPEARPDASAGARPHASQVGRPEAKPKGKPKVVPRPKATHQPPMIRPADEPCYVTFKFTAEQYSRWAAFNARKAKLTKEEALIAALRVQTPVSPSDSGYIIIIQECPTCRMGTLTNNRGTFEAPRALLEEAHCDGIIEDEEARRRRVIPNRLRRKVLRRDNQTCQTEGCPNTQHLVMHHRVPIAQGGKTEISNLVTLCARCHKSLHESEDELRKSNHNTGG
jgi:hypothetical protein